MGAFYLWEKLLFKHFAICIPQLDMRPQIDFSSDLFFQFRRQSINGNDDNLFFKIDGIFWGYAVHTAKIIAKISAKAFYRYCSFFS